MDKRLKFAGGEVEISSDELNLMPESNSDAIESTNNGLNPTLQDMIVSGVNAVINAGTNVIVEDGFVVLNGETLKVDAITVPSVIGDLYEFEKLTTYPADGERNFRDGSTQMVYEINRAVITNVAVISTLSVVGETIMDKLKTAIRVQSDWNQANTSEPDFIKNKPTTLVSLMKGECVFGDIDGNPAGALTVSGQLSSANKVNLGGASTVTFTFPSVGTSDYTVSLNWLNLGGNIDMKAWVIDNQTATSLTIATSEDGGVTQNFNIRVHLFN